MGMHLERRTQSTAQLVTNMDVLTTVGHKKESKRKQNPEEGIQKCPEYALFERNYARPCVPLQVCAKL